jgi:hypothetical protein
MKSVNKVILLGLVGHDPEVKVTASGIPVGRHLSKSVKHFFIFSYRSSVLLLHRPGTRISQLTMQLLLVPAHSATSPV